MKRFWRHKNDRADWPEPRPEFLGSLSEHVRETRRRPRPSALRLGLAAGFTAALLVAFASVGGLGYAASTVTKVAKVTHIAHATAKRGDHGNKPDKDQYKEERKQCKKTERARHHAAEQNIKNLPKNQQKAARKAEEDLHKQNQKACHEIGK